jgi:hypothetical protein
MSAFDPNNFRKAVAEFTPRRPEKFHDLLPAKDVIAELRQKGASYRAVAELLTQHCLPTSKTAVAAFCHEMLGETLRPRRRQMRRRATPIPENGHNVPAFNPAELPAAPEAGEIHSPRTRGPRIAQVRTLKPQSA